MISKTEVDRLLKIAKSGFRSKTRVNKIMFGKVDEVAKETSNFEIIFGREHV